MNDLQSQAPRSIEQMAATNAVLGGLAGAISSISAISKARTPFHVARGNMFWKRTGSDIRSVKRFRSTKRQHGVGSLPQHLRLADMWAGGEADGRIGGKSAARDEPSTEYHQLRASVLTLPVHVLCPSHQRAVPNQGGLPPGRALLCRSDDLLPHPALYEFDSFTYSLGFDGFADLYGVVGDGSRDAAHYEQQQ